MRRSCYERRTPLKDQLDLLTEYAKGRLVNSNASTGVSHSSNHEQDLVIHITYRRATEAAVRRGRARAVESPNGGGSSRWHSVNRVHVDLIPGSIDLHVTHWVDLEPGSTSYAKRKMLRAKRYVWRWKMTKCEMRVDRAKHNSPNWKGLARPSEFSLDPDASTPIQRSVPIPPVLGGVDPTVLSRQLSKLLEKVSAPSVAVAGATARLGAEIAEEARNAWLNEFMGTLTSELQTLRTEGTKAKLTGKVPDRDWLHEAKQRWRAHPTPENLFCLTEALEEHEDQILVREKMFLKHTKYLTVTVGDEEAPPDISKVAVVLCRRNDVLYTSAEQQEQLDRPFTNFLGWNCAVSSEGGTINVPEQFRGGTMCSICQQLIGPSGAYLIATCPHIFHLECLVRTMRQGQVKCPNCRIPFHRDMMRKFYMERIALLEHAATYFGDPVQLRRSRLILLFLFDCLDRYITMFEGEMPLEHRKEMLSVFFKEVDTKFPDSVLDVEDRYPGPYDLRAELKHLLSFYLRREIADREEIADYMQQVGSHFMRRTWPPECWNNRVIERNLAVVHGIPFHDLG
ncbi:hypothetical protein R1flu_014353 [Riccia fluitans]|uniref:RING-type domain-containing protein n=1 Tax=Riccia fluitans TaxID=41844 RepID=A0ABD1YJ06_9MARC